MDHEKSGFKILLTFQLMEFHLYPKCFHRTDTAGSLHACTCKYSCRSRNSYCQNTEVVFSGETGWQIFSTWRGNRNQKSLCCIVWFCAIAVTSDTSALAVCMVFHHHSYLQHYMRTKVDFQSCWFQGGDDGLFICIWHIYIYLYICICIKFFLISCCNITDVWYLQKNVVARI